MSILKNIYGDTSLSLVMDQYELTAAYVFWKNNLHNVETCFHLFHRQSPFKGGYAICAGLEYVIDWVQNFQFTEDDIRYIASLTGNDGKPLFPDEAFLNWLRSFKFTCDIDAMPEGTICFPHEPMLRVTGSIIDCLFLESFSLCTINSQSLFATLASRIVSAAKGAPVLDGGLRRAQGIDGAISAARACYIGGIAGTSNMFAGRVLGIPSGGTMQHAFVMFFDTELEAFEKYADALPNNCVFLTDTYDTLEGTKNAMKVSLKLQENGHKPIGIRLDSGDLAWLSNQSRDLLDNANLESMKISASNDLDEHLISSLQQQGCDIASWIVGTKMITSYNQAAFGGVYKLGAILKDGKWVSKIKLSEQMVKTTNPGTLNVLRYMSNDNCFYIGDRIIDELDNYVKEHTIVDINNPMRTKKLAKDTKIEDGKCAKNISIKKLLMPIFYRGKLQYKIPSLKEIKANASVELWRLDESIKRFDNPHEYPVGLSVDLHDKKIKMIKELRG